MTRTEIDKMKKMLEEVETFDKKQVMEAFYWMALGDGSIEVPERGDCLLSVSHSAKHQDYVVWKSAIVERALRCSIKPMLVKGGFGADHDMYRLRTQHHPWFTKVRDRLYGPLGRKAIDSMALSLLGPLGLAILYQDDGSYHYSTNAGHNIMLHKLCFSIFELEAFAKVVVDRWGIIFRINRNEGKGFGFRLRLRAKDREKFFALIDPYIVPSMLYKVGKGSIVDSTMVI
jgi:hypothetical protein